MPKKPGQRQEGSQLGSNSFMQPNKKLRAENDQKEKVGKWSCFRFE